MTEQHNVEPIIEELERSHHVARRLLLESECHSAEDARQRVRDFLAAEAPAWATKRLWSEMNRWLRVFEQLEKALADARGAHEASTARITELKKLLKAVPSTVRDLDAHGARERELKNVMAEQEQLAASTREAQRCLPLLRRSIDLLVDAALVVDQERRAEAWAALFGRIKAQVRQHEQGGGPDPGVLNRLGQHLAKDLRWSPAVCPDAVLAAWVDGR